MQTYNVGIGFATGRKSFQRVLRSYIGSWKESGLTDKQNIRLNLFVAYDLKYNNTKIGDYTTVGSDIRDYVDQKYFIGKKESEDMCAELVGRGVINAENASMIFVKGYAAQRNSILYSAVKHKMDCLLFLDDDEYPLAVTKTFESAIWSGQHVLKNHLSNIKNADITYGRHCGYVSPIPYFEIEDNREEKYFRQFIEAISNDIIDWPKLKKIMRDGGVTYADKKILRSREISEVMQAGGAKFISGSNLCINLTEPGRVYPFYNPPGARGEDTFLSTCLAQRKVLRLPCYTFHDGFSIYNHLLSGVLPTELKKINSDSAHVTRRFYKACIGWVRYKPLFMYITDRESFDEKIKCMRKNLAETLPYVCRYFDTNDFMQISREFEKYTHKVQEHYDDFMRVKKAWAAIMNDSVQ